MFCPIAKERSSLGSHFVGGLIDPSMAFSAFDKEQQANIHQRCWKKNLELRSLRDFKGKNVPLTIQTSVKFREL